MKRILIRVISILEIVGGFVGILFMLYAVTAAGFAFPIIVVAPFLIGVFVLSLAGGLWLWQGKEKGRKVSIVIQCIQLPKIISSPLIFMFTFGLDMYAHITVVNDLSTVGIQFSFLADAQFFLNSYTPMSLVGISVTSIIALVALWTYDAKANEDEPLHIPPGPDNYIDLT